jgi:hypothetical protein
MSGSRVTNPLTQTPNPRLTYYLEAFMEIGIGLA